MNSDIRRVTIFFTVGLLVAAAVGFGVWRMGAPSAVTATPPMESTSTTENTHRATSSDDSDEETTTDQPNSRNPSADRPQIPDYSNDPFLAPNSVVNPQRQPTSTPTSVYRPEPIFGEEPYPQDTYVEQTPTLTPESPATTGESTQLTTPGDSAEATTPSSQTPEPNTSSPTTTRPNYTDRDDDDRPSGGLPSPSQPSDPSEPSEPAEPSEPSEPADPSEPSEPEEPSVVPGEVTIGGVSSEQDAE